MVIEHSEVRRDGKQQGSESLPHSDIEISKGSQGLMRADRSYHKSNSYEKRKTRILTYPRRLLGSPCLPLRERRWGRFLSFRRLSLRRKTISGCDRQIEVSLNSKECEDRIAASPRLKPLCDARHISRCRDVDMRLERQSAGATDQEARSRASVKVLLTIVVGSVAR